MYAVRRLLLLAAVLALEGCVSVSVIGRDGCGWHLVRVGRRPECALAAWAR